MPTLSAVPSRLPVSVPPANVAKRPPLSSAEERLLSHLNALPFAEFTRLLAGLLREMGYRDVRLMGATHARGRNHHGGLDLQASLASDLNRSLVIAQAKQYSERTLVPRAYVDELRGTMLRLGAQQGLIFTTSAFAHATQMAAQAGQHVAPVRLIDGPELARLLLAHPRVLEADTAHATPPTPVRDAHGRYASWRPLSKEEADRMEREFLDGLGAPPDAGGRDATPEGPAPDTGRLALRIDLLLSPFPPRRQCTQDGRRI